MNLVGGYAKTGIGAPGVLAFSPPPLRVSIGDSIYCKFSALKSPGKPRCKEGRTGWAGSDLFPA